MLRKQRDKYHTQKDFTNYRKFHNKVSFMIKKSKQKYFVEAIYTDKDTKTLWKYLKELHPKEEPSLPTQLKVDDKIISQMQEVVEHLYNHFCHLADKVKTQKHTPDYELLEVFITTKCLDTTGQIQISTY